MHLSSLTLVNIRQFEHRAFEFQPGFNLLVGENGAGKTTILRSMLAALGGDRSSGRRATIGDEDIQLRKRYAEVRATINLADGRTEDCHFRRELWGRAERPARLKKSPLVLLYASNEAICAAMKGKRPKRIHAVDSDPVRSSEEFLYQAERQFSRSSPNQRGSRFGNSQSVREFVSKVLSTFSRDFRDFFWRFEPYDCTLILPKDRKGRGGWNPEIENEARRLAMRYFQEGWSEKMPFAWPDQPKVVLTPDGLERREYEGRLPELHDIWNRTRLSSDARKIIESCSLEVKLTPRIMIRRKIGPLSLSQLSDGEQRLFSLFVDIARRLSLREPGDEIGNGEAIVLIDEIDVHLHPKWQRQIVPALESLFSQCQFIATTHSPFIVQAAPAGGVQHIEGTPIGDVADRGIEEIAQKAMHVDGETGGRYLEMLEAAKTYLRALDDTESTSRRQVLALRRKLAQLSGRYARNPAYQAFLELRTDAKLGSEG